MTTTSPGTSLEDAVATELRVHFARTGLLQRDAAAAADIPVPSFSRKMNGQSTFTLTELAAVADFLGTTIEDVITEARKALR